MAWYHFGRECPYSKLTLCQEKYCTDCGIYLNHVEELQNASKDSETSKQVEVAGVPRAEGVGKSHQ
jgi:hypothetical protein